MPGQANITKFFRPIATSTTPSKSNAEAKKEGNVAGSGCSQSENISPNKLEALKTPEKSAEAKKRKLDEAEASPSATPGAFTPDQKRRALENQLRAKIKLTSNSLNGALHSNIGPTWFAALESEFKQDYFASLSKFVDSERKSNGKKIFPPAEQVWSWTHHFDIKDTKVVILGQDPYHGPGQAHGLCFSVQKGVRAPPSLVNMYKELEEDVPGFVIPKHGFLEGWAKQGVLLLNACLTVRQGEANSHKDRGWEKLTDAVVKCISSHCHGVVFFLWGSYAQKKAAVVDGKKHHLLKTVHPSPLSAHRGFLGCKHFSKCNELLKREGKTPIDWTKLD